MKVPYYLLFTVSVVLSCSTVVVVVNGANLQQQATSSRAMGIRTKAVGTNTIQHQRPQRRSNDSDAVVTLTEENFDTFLKSHADVFVDFDAPWCVWCQRLVPTWQKFALELKRQNVPLKVGKVDCMAQASVCRKQKITAFPTMRWFHKGEAEVVYKLDRTPDALMGFAKRKLDIVNSTTDRGISSGASFASKREPTSSGEEDYAEESDENGVPGGQEEEGLEAIDGIAFSDETRPGPLDPKPDNTVGVKCQLAGLPYGNAIQRVSYSSGNELPDYLNMKQVKIAPACRSASDNPRGKYNSFYSPCEFHFHVVPSSSNAKSSSSSSSNSFHLSTVCSTNNVYNFGNDEGEEGSNNLEIENKRMDYVREWPDECVGDYKRCYSLAKNSEANILLPHLCRNQWEIPEGVTHISVTCQDDKKRALQKQEEAREINSPRNNFLMEQMDKHHRERMMVLLLVVALVCCCCWLVLCLGYARVIVPYLKAIKKSKSDPDLQSLVDAVDGKTETATTAKNKKRENT